MLGTRFQCSLSKLLGTLNRLIVDMMTLSHLHITENWPSRINQIIKILTKLTKINANWMSKFFTIRSNKANRNLIIKIDSNLSHGLKDTSQMYLKRQRPNHHILILVLKKNLNIRISIIWILYHPKLMIEETTLMSMTRSAS